MRKKYLLAALLILAVGFATISTTLYINGTSTINSNDADFKVYYSDAKVNGTQDLSVVVDETHLSFTTTLDTLGETYVLDYDVTNGSKNYDAALTMNCTGGNDYLTVTNNFDTATNLAALQTRSGKLTLALTKSYTGADLDVTITCTLNATAVERNTLGEGTAASPVAPVIPEEPSTSPFIYTDSDGDGKISVGDVYVLRAEPNERFNVISQTEDAVTLLASNVLGKDYRQTNSTTYSEYGVAFASTNGWEYKPGPKEIDIFTWSSNPKTYVNEYVSYLQSETGATSISGNLITLAELKTLGCTINDDYSHTSGLTCANSDNASWIVNGQYWWTRSATSGGNYSVWAVKASGELSRNSCEYTGSGVRPVITISKEDLKNEDNTDNILDAQTFCENKDYSYGMLNTETYGWEIGDGEVQDGDKSKAYYLCSNDIDFNDTVYGYDLAGNLVYTFMQGTEEQ